MTSTRMCRQCSGEIPGHRRHNARYCSDSCKKLHFRQQHPEKCREWVRTANTRRYLTDAEYRAERQAYINAWRRRDYRKKQYGDAATPILGMHKDRYKAARDLGYRSGLEVLVARQLDDAGAPFEYETLTVPYRVEETRKYTPDILLPNGLVIELKGRWTTADRKKTRLVMAQHPDVDLRLVFSNSRTRISKQSKTTYGAFCMHLGIPYADKLIPASWLVEPPNLKSLAAIQKLR